VRAFRFLTNFEISSEEISKNRKNFETAREGDFDFSFFFLVYTVALALGRETAIGYKKAKTNRNWVQILHFYHAKTVNTDIRLLWRSVASTKEF